VLTSYRYRLLKGAPWGIAIDLRAGQEPAAVATNAKKVAERLWLRVDTERPLSEEQVGFLVEGLYSVADEIVARAHGPVQVRVAELTFNPTDYQAEGLAAAIAGWAAQEFGFPVPEVPVIFDRRENRYVFQRAAARPVVGNARAVVDAPACAPVPEAVLSVVRRIWKEAYFQDAAGTEVRPWRSYPVLANASKSSDFFVYRDRNAVAGAAGGAAAPGAPNRVIRFLTEPPAADHAYQRLTLLFSSQTPEIDALVHSLKRTLRANEVAPIRGQAA
jgi:hypothetical protein